MTDGIVFHIQRFSVHDGPGIRTTVFLKGCSLGCAWCHNPEGIRLSPELRYQESLCIHCGSCVEVCPEGAQQLREGRHRFERDRCTACGKCVGACPTGALLMAGRRMEAREVVEEVLVDRVFYEASAPEARGGLTLSGGEPAYQAEFASAILSLARERGLHTAIQTAAHVAWPRLESLVGNTDLVMIDIKHMDPDRHREATGADNSVVLANAERLAATDRPMVVRVPVVPGFNATPEQIGSIRRFVDSLRKLRPPRASLALELLPFHPLGTGKYESLQIANPTASLTPPSTQLMAELRDAARLLHPSEDPWQTPQSVPA